MYFYVHLFAVLVTLFAFANANNSNFTNLQINAIVGLNNETIFQCWKVEPAFEISNRAGIEGIKVQPLGNFTDASIFYFDERNFTAWGYHNPPSPKYITFIRGGGIVRLRNSTEVLVVQPGTVFFAADTVDVAPQGHDTYLVPGSISVQLPVYGGLPNHTVVSNNLCAETWGY